MSYRRRRPEKDDKNNTESHYNHLQNKLTLKFFNEGMDTQEALDKAKAEIDALRVPSQQELEAQAEKKKAEEKRLEDDLFAIFRKKGFEVDEARGKAKNEFERLFGRGSGPRPTAGRRG